jgi:serine protease Do
MAMLNRYVLPAFAVIVLAVPAPAQPRKDRIAATSSIKSNQQFLKLFQTAIEQPAKSTVRVQVDGKDAALGTVVAENGYVVTKASEIKEGKVTVKTRDGRDLDAKLTTASDTYDLAVLKVDGSGLTPITWSSTREAPVGNWLAIPGLGEFPVAVGVVSTKPRSPAPPYGPPRVPTEQSGFLGVQLDMEGTGAVIDRVTPESAADKAGVRPKDLILRIDAHEIVSQESLINTLLTYKAGEKVKILLEREGKRMELTATLGKRPLDLIPKGKGPNRGDMQNSMGSTLSERRTGIPRFFQTDAVVKPSDCGGPVVDLDGRVVGLMIARAGRTESHAIPAETIKGLLPVLLAPKPNAKPAEKVTAIREAMELISAEEVPADVQAEAKRLLRAAEAEERWWKDLPIEAGPEPRVVK